VVIIIIILLLLIAIVIISLIIIIKPTFDTNQLYTTPALDLQAKGQRAGGMPKAVE
jgi:uncharacterized protein YxeA